MLPGNAKAIADGRVAPVEPDHGRAYQGGVGEKDDEVLGQVEKENHRVACHARRPKLIGNQGVK